MTVNLAAAVREQARIGTITVTGGEATFPGEGELERILDLSPGEKFSAEVLDSAILRVREKFSEIRFLDTRVEATRDYDPVKNVVNLAVTIRPGQLVYISARGTDVSDEGIRDLLPDDRLRGLVPVYEEGAYEPDLLREGRARIMEYLQQQGYFEATVAEHEEIPAPFDNAVQVNFRITLGERHRIRSVRIQGNTYFSEEELRELMQIRGAGFMDRGVYAPAILSADIDTLDRVYRRAGFEDVQVKAHQEDSPSHQLDILIDIQEGRRYKVERITFSGNMTLSEGELRRPLRLTEGSDYSPAEAEAAVLALMALYYSRGYPDARINAAADRNPDTGGRALTFQITEGQPYLIGRIIVSGNTRTADKVVRNRSGLREYEDPYNPEAILQAQQRLYATGLFNRVEVVPLDQEAGPYRTLLVQVEDARPIMVSPGLGVKEYTGPRATLDISHNNLFGLDRSLSMRVRWGVHERQFQTTYREPRLFNRERLEGYGTLSIEKSDLRYFEARRLDFSVQAVQHLSPSSSLLATASYQTVNLQDIKVNPAFRRFPDLKGIIQIASLGAQYAGDWRTDAEGRTDSINPERGSSTTGRFQIASRSWGSEVDFVALFNQTNYFKPTRGGVFAFSTRLGWKQPYGNDVELPISERYFAGGSTTLRGFDLDAAGPPGGGQLMTIGNVEYRAPLRFVPSRLGRFGAALFYDTGTVFERPSDFSLSAFTHSAGAGLRYQTPIGPVRFDVGFNLRPKLLPQGDGTFVREERVQFFFTLGHAF
jgi:outer membrane protein assembly complex protein YaeT